MATVAAPALDWTSLAGGLLGGSAEVLTQNIAPNDVIVYTSPVVAAPVFTSIIPEEPALGYPS